jgi:hypothetical protein
LRPTLTTELAARFDPDGWLARILETDANQIERKTGRANGNGRDDPMA